MSWSSGTSLQSWILSLHLASRVIIFIWKNKTIFNSKSEQLKKKSSLRNYQQGVLFFGAAEVTTVAEVAEVAEVAIVAEVAVVLIFNVILFLVQMGLVPSTHQPKECSVSLHGIHALDIHTSIFTWWHSQIYLNLYHICSFQSLPNEYICRVIPFYRLMYAIPWVFSMPHIPLPPSFLKHIPPLHIGIQHSFVCMSQCSPQGRAWPKNSSNFHRWFT